MAKTSTDIDLLLSCRTLIAQDGRQSLRARELYAQFHTAHYGAVYRRAAARVGERFADDVTADIFIRIWDWLCGSADLLPQDVMINLCLSYACTDHQRRLGGRGRSKGDYQDQPRGTDPRSPLSLDASHENLRALIEDLDFADPRQVEDVVLERESNEELREALRQIKPHYRLALIYRHIMGFSVEETAAQLNLTPDRVKKYTARGGVALVRILHRDARS
jgi:RNA polymerase sigma factor (sigma-70 family)